MSVSQDSPALGAEIRRYLLAQRSGMLSTLSQRLGGYPFGSLVPYILDHQARPVLLISNLAEHTRNLAADPRVSLLVSDAAGDIQAGARVTLVGDAQAPDDAELPATRDRYLRFFPNATQLLELGDFKFMVIRPITLRFIGGFGRIHWISAENYTAPANQLANAEGEVVAHMNSEHAEALADYCRHYLQQSPDAIAMIGIDCDGIDLRADNQLARIDFDEPVTSSAAARSALVRMAQVARGH